MVGLCLYVGGFLAVVQLMVYVGGILVLILFAVMLTNRITDVKHSNPSNNIPVGVALLASMLFVMLTALLGHDWPTKAAGPFEPTAAMLGRAFLGDYLLPFEVAGLMLLAALLAAVVIARKEIRHDDDYPPSKESRA
ncbi:MAG: NADH-quinone oxidoreductase subunit J [Myxococcota bacterium]